MCHGLVCTGTSTTASQPIRAARGGNGKSVTRQTRQLKKKLLCQVPASVVPQLPLLYSESASSVVVSCLLRTSKSTSIQFDNASQPRRGLYNVSAVCLECGLAVGLLPVVALDSCVALAPSQGRSRDILVVGKNEKKEENNENTENIGVFIIHNL